MKRYLLALAILTISATGFAQDTEIKKLVLSVGAEGAIPVGDYKDAYSIGLGGTAQAEYMVAPKFGVTLNAGYINFSGENNIESVGQIPVLAGGRFYFVKDIYVSGQLGVSILTGGDDSESGFTYAPGIGAKFSVLDVTLKYTSTSINSFNFSNVGLRVAFNF
jgi:hypothetical protein